MAETPDEPTHLLDELKRRKVVRAGLVYGAGAFAVLQVADIVVDPLGFPAWTMTALIWLVLIGFGVTLVVSWYVDLPSVEGSTRGWLSARAALAVAGLVAIGMTAGWLLRPVGAGDDLAGGELDGSVAVVMPFSVSGSDDYAYLSDAVARLLTSSLDGTAGLRTVSPHALLGYPGLDPGAAVTEPLAHAAGDHFGAGVVLMGNVVEAGDSIRIEATLIDRVRVGAAPVTAGVTTAASSDLLATVDRLAARLVAEREAGAGSVRTRTAALTTSSLEALRAYIEGERASDRDPTCPRSTPSRVRSKPTRPSPSRTTA